MKSSVLQRKLFMKPPVKKAEGGILSLVAGDEEMEDNYQDRTPDNIEIIANNLRGDMRSMDERYMELAQMVGESAFETPPEVLALMQPQLAQQMQPAQPAAPNARPAGIEQIAASTPPGAPPAQGQAPQPGMPQPQPQQPGGIEALVAEAPQQAPVQRSEGSPETAEVSPSRIQEIIPETDLLAMGDMGSDDDIDAALQNYFDTGGTMEKLAEVAATPMSIEITGVGDVGLPGSNEDEGVPVVTDMKFDRALPFKNAGIGSLMPKKKDAGFSPDISKFMGKDAVDSNAETAAAYANMMRFASPVKRQAGSPPFGERADPRFNTADYFVDPDGTVRPRSGPGVYPEDDIYRSGEGLKKSRPLTLEELQQRIADREARTMTKGERAIKGISNFFGQGLKIDPDVAETRLRSFLKGASKIPGVGKVAKYADILLPAGALAVGATMMEDPKPEVGDGVVPTLPNLPDGSPSLANQIPPVAGSPLRALPNRESDAADAAAMGQLMDDVTRQELRRDDSPAPKVVDVDLINPFDPDAPNAYTGENVPPGDAIEAAEAAPTPSAADLAKRPGESDDDFRTRVMARANLYKELLGQDPESQKAQAYFLLAEAGLALAGAKGRSQGERISKGLKGLPSGLAKIASEKTQLDRTATAAAISAVEQEDRDLMKYATQLRLRQATIDKESAPRLRKIQQHFALFKAQDPNMTDEQATILATGMVDGVYKADKFGNILGPANDIVNRGPAMQPTQPGQVGYIADDNPFLVVGKETMPAVVTEEEVGKARKERADTAKLLAGIQTAIPLIEKTYGIGNVLTRAVTVGVTPFVGDVGPFSADKLQASNAIRLLQRNLRELLAVNESRISVYEQQQIDGLYSEPDDLLATPGQAVGQLQNLVRSLTNRINQIDNSLNPNTPLKQLKEVPLGTQNDPVPAYATRALGSFFEARPNGVIYVQRQDGKVFGFTKDQWEKAQGQQ